MSAVKQIKRSNGDSYPVRYEVNAYCHFEDITGKNLVQIMARPDLFDFRSIRAMIFVGVVYGMQYSGKECNLTLQDIGKWDDAMNIFSQCMAALKAQSPNAKEGKSDDSGE